MARDRLAAMRVSILQPSLLVNRKVACKLPILQQTSSQVCNQIDAATSDESEHQITQSNLAIDFSKTQEWLTECLSSPSSVYPSPRYSFFYSPFRLNNKVAEMVDTVDMVEMQTMVMGKHQPWISILLSFLSLLSFSPLLSAYHPTLLI